MIQFNLLPDVKIEYIKARRLKRLITASASAVMVCFVAVSLLLFIFVNFLQAKHLKDLNKDITANSSQIGKIQDLDKILTIQNQLGSLPGLHAQKPIASRLFTYIGQVTPANVSIATVKADLTTYTINFTGSADSLASVNTFTDTLKFTKYQKKDDANQQSAFSQVVLSSFGRDEKNASYSIDLVFAPAILDGSSEITLVVPKQITTRSETEKPADLFKPLSTTTSNLSNPASKLDAPLNSPNSPFSGSGVKGAR